MFKSAFARFQTAINLNQNSGLDDVTNASSQSSLIQRKRGVVRECIEAGLMTVIGSLFIFTFVVQDVRVETGSMKNTIQVG
ncbi:MAG TPA: hypothetical protein PLU80_21690, partial [Acidobacteriota bacterium]|nr:hypothetical protein [Acidobacteriota bacterium]